MKKSKIQRMRNIVSGNHSSKTKISTGYVKSRSKNIEGDVWEESGKTWTIKNGIKQTISKLDLARKATQTPLTCPKCGDGRMTHPAYKAMYHKFGMCLNCVAHFENDLRASGKYEAYTDKLSKSNDAAWLKDVTGEYYSWLETLDNESFITEAGDIEDWSGGKSADTLRSEFDAQVIKYKEDNSNE